MDSLYDYEAWKKQCQVLFTPVTKTHLDSCKLLNTIWLFQYKWVSANIQNNMEPNLPSWSNSILLCARNFEITMSRLYPGACDDFWDSSFSLSHFSHNDTNT